jgi:hypothetical protein
MIVIKLNITPEALACYNARRAREETRREEHKRQRDTLTQEYLKSILHYDRDRVLDFVS